jgi:hypothetical protein
MRRGEPPQGRRAKPHIGENRSGGVAPSGHRDELEPLAARCPLRVRLAQE